MTQALSPAIEPVTTVPSHLITSAKPTKRSRDSVSSDCSEASTSSIEPASSPITSVEVNSPRLNLFGFEPERFNLKRAKKHASVKFDFFINPSRKELEHLDPDFKTPTTSQASDAVVPMEKGASEEYQYNWGLEACQPFLFISTLPPLPDCYLKRPYALPKKTRSSPKMTLVLDLDETLVHCNFQGMADPDIVFPLEFGLSTYTIYAKVRPYYKEFIERVSQKFEVVVFTASTKEYANRLLNILDPTGKHIKYRLFRDTCAMVQGTYLKDLTVLGRDLSKTIIVDNQPQVFGYQLSNGIPIPSFYDDKSDKYLLQLIPVLEDLAEMDDVRQGIAARFGFQEQVNSIHLALPTFPTNLADFDIFTPTYI
ncbi:hypothetical protein DSO57_1019213 [Entomophthora muscae]|uniref:Uncharacterized protein n=1 Tax=Entomophthora muscae TaxID=34485 RepID=A0ACC2U2K4_9FUNG|nr:hypothetical protein DSO57_1019213 [Entomophthora muscae]